MGLLWIGFKILKKKDSAKTGSFGFISNLEFGRSFIQAHRVSQIKFYFPSRLSGMFRRASRMGDKADL
jgi:hypothetical protein